MGDIMNEDKPDLGGLNEHMLEFSRTRAKLASCASSLE